MSWLPLPPELILIIAESLEPYACLALARTCRRSWSLCRHLVEHHKKQFVEKPESISFWRNRVDGWEWLRDIAVDETRAWYVRELFLPEWGPPSFLPTAWDGNSDPREITPSTFSDEDTDRYVAMFRKAKDVFHAPQSREQITASSVDGSAIPISVSTSPVDPAMHHYHPSPMTVLLHHLPNLNTFGFCGKSGHDFRDLIRHVARAPVIDGFKGHRIPFRHLTTVAVDSPYNPSVVNYFMAIPSVRRIAASRLKGQWRLLSSDDTLSRECNVDELFLYACSLNQEDLRKILSELLAHKKIKKFSYSGYLSNTLPRNTILGDLAETIGHSVEYLELRDLRTAFAESHERPISLRNYQKLRTLCCPSGILFPENIQPDFDLKTVLPETLETLHLASSKERELIGPAKVLINCKERCNLPKLQNLFIYYTGWKSEHVDNLNRRLGGHKIPDMDENPLERYAWKARADSEVVEEDSNSD